MKEMPNFLQAKEKESWKLLQLSSVGNVAWIGDSTSSRVVLNATGYYITSAIPR
jgi:hypothetical protein